jgi:rod shape-determining protein MreC
VMARKKINKSYLIIGLVVLLIVSLPVFFVQNFRSVSVSMVTPFSGGEGHIDELQALRLEKSLLNFELERYRLLIENQAFEAKTFLSAHPAKVIYRDPASWSSMVWVGAGEKEGITKNSPVLLGDAVVGVVDYVGNHKSRVRLITDSGLVPSVRVARGKQQNTVLSNRIEVLLEDLLTCGNLVGGEEKKDLVELLGKVKKSLDGTEEESYMLAKGELHGMGQPVWRSAGQVLKGVGFNYDYPDEYGPARDLRTGEPVSGGSKVKVMPIIEEGDLLVTTGMDGVFPKGLPVARVLKIGLLREGAYMYEIEATPVAGDLNDLSMVFIIPGESLEEL